ncbi:MAG: hypothetical protein IJC38_05725 [Erysipelotrichaceae bacterium]|nr:hypothetical protein [Erysipelotrichaceae bacterium]
MQTFRKICLSIAAVSLINLGFEAIFDLNLIERWLVNTPTLKTFLKICCLISGFQLLLMMFEKE